MVPLDSLNTVKPWNPAQNIIYLMDKIYHRFIQNYVVHRLFSHT